MENTARDPLARAKRVAVDNEKINYKKKQVRRKRTCESASQSAQDTSQFGRRPL